MSRPKLDLSDNRCSFELLSERYTSIIGLLLIILVALSFMLALVYTVWTGARDWLPLILVSLIVLFIAVDWFKAVWRAKHPRRP